MGVTRVHSRGIYSMIVLCNPQIWELSSFGVVGVVKFGTVVGDSC